jgi:hypothetical protein
VEFAVHLPLKGVYLRADLCDHHSQRAPPRGHVWLARCRTPWQGAQDVDERHRCFECVIVQLLRHCRAEQFELSPCTQNGRQIPRRIGRDTLLSERKSAYGLEVCVPPSRHLEIDGRAALFIPRFAHRSKEVKVVSSRTAIPHCGADHPAAQASCHHDNDQPHRHHRGEGIACPLCVVSGVVDLNAPLVANAPHTWLGR